MIDDELQQRAIHALLALPAMSAGSTETDCATLCAATVFGLVRPIIDGLKADLEKANKAAANANADADMYANAWGRELGQVVNKRHHIDAMVVTTRRLMEAYHDGVRRGVIDNIFYDGPKRGSVSRGVRDMDASDIGMGPKDIAARAAVDEIKADLRDRRLLKWFFAEEPNQVCDHFAGIEPDVQREIFGKWERIIWERMQ